MHYATSCAIRPERAWGAVVRAAPAARRAGGGDHVRPRADCRSVATVAGTSLAVRCWAIGTSDAQNFSLSWSPPPEWCRFEGRLRRNLDCVPDIVQPSLLHSSVLLPFIGWEEVVSKKEEDKKGPGVQGCTGGTEDGCARLHRSCDYQGHYGVLADTLLNGD
jgi:hypothetical protein